MKESSIEGGGITEGGAASGPAMGAAAWWGRRCGSGGYGQPVPLDSECKARQLRLLRPCAAPHMRSFYLAMLSHFVAVFCECWGVLGGQTCAGAASMMARCHAAFCPRGVWFLESDKTTMLCTR